MKTPEEWQKLVEQLKQEGTSIRKFCRDYGLIESTFSYWVKKSKQKDLGFIAIKPTSESKNNKEKWTLKVGSSMSLEIPSNYQATELKKIIRDLQSCL